MTVFWTIFAGVCVYVIGQLVLKFVIEPVHQQRETIGKIIDFLIYHANRYTNPGIHMRDDLADRRGREDELTETKEKARLLASEFMVRTQAVPGYGALERLRLVPKRAGVRIAQENLFVISNSMFELGNAMDNYDAARSIEEALGIVTEFQIEEKARPAAGDAEVG